MVATDSTLAPAQLASKVFDALNTRDLDSLVALSHEDSTETFLALGLTVTGKPALRAFWEQVFTAAPDARIDVLRITADEEVAWSHWNLIGTHTGGHFQGVAPTGRRIDLRGADCMEFDGGLMRHNTIFYDAATFGRQVGMLPALGSATDKAMIGAFNAVARLRGRLKRS